MLTIVPMGGLCNRLRVVLSALALSHDYDGQIRIEWGATAECKAWFEDLFVPLNSGRLSIVHRHWWAYPSRKAHLHMLRMVRLLLGYTCQHDDYAPRSKGEMENMMHRHKKVYISTGYTLTDYPPECLRRLKPRSELQQRIDQLCRQFTDHMVGVHIRRTDNAKSISNSPLAAFVKAMRSEVAADSSVHFFLATDDAEVKAELKRLFPHRIITQERRVERHTLEGMHDALVDLWCLAATSRVLGSYWSSFSDAAAEIGHIPLTVVRADS